MTLPTIVLRCLGPLTSNPSVFKSSPGSLWSLVFWGFPKYLFFIFFFAGYRVCWPLLCLSRPVVFEGRLDLNLEICRSKQARYQLELPFPNIYALKSSIMYQCPMIFWNSGAMAFRCPLRKSNPPLWSFYPQVSGVLQVPMSSVFCIFRILYSVLSSWIFLAPSSHAGFLESSRVLYFLASFFVKHAAMINVVRYVLASASPIFFFCTKYSDLKNTTVRNNCSRRQFVANFPFPS